MKKFFLLQRKWCVAKRSFSAVCVAILSLLLFASCGRSVADPIIIWTNRSEIVTYVELFNLTADNVRAVVIYKENPAESFPPKRGEDVPDVIIGPWLKNTETQSTFMPLNYLFDDQLVSKTQFYPQLLQFGSIGSQQYLLPVSFNLSTIVFSQENSAVAPENNMLTTDQIRDLGGNFNVMDEDVYTSMGFAPSWTPEFLYEVAKLNNSNFAEHKRNTASFYWNAEELENTVEYFRDWTSSKNTSTIAETEYQFKYLYNPALKNVSDTNALFAFMKSDELFVSAPERLDGIYFSWIQNNNKIAIHDDMLSLGLYKHSENLPAAEQFVIWLMNEDTQQTILNWYDSLNMYTNTFGLAGGFSSIRSVNERLYPVLYPVLWGNLPPQDALSAPNSFPSNWEEIKEEIIIPYLVDAVNTDNSSPAQTIQERLTDWYRFTQ